MSLKASQVDHYLMRHMESNADGRKEFVFFIGCFLGQNKDHVGTINFYLKGHVPPSTVYMTTENPPKEKIRVNMSINRINEVLDTIRNESPIYIGVATDVGYGWVGTAPEPVGEEES